MERYEAYKDSGVEWIGEIPTGWDLTRFGSVCSSSLGKMLTNEPRTATSKLEPYLKAANVQEDGINLASIQEMYFDAGEEEQYGLLPGDLLVVEGGSVGVSQIWNGAIQGCFIQNALHRVRPRHGASVRFLKYALDCARYSGYINLVCNKATIAHFTKEKLLATPLVVPAPSEQQVIADYLDAKTAEIDALVADCEREVGLLQEYRKAVISEAVTKGLDPDAPMKDSGIEWIGEIPETWLATPLKHVVVSIESGTSLDGANWPASENEKGILTLSAVYQSRFDAIQNKAVLPELYNRLSCPLRSGTLLISRCNTSEWVGTAAYVHDAPDNLFLPDKLWQLSFASDCVCRFIQYSLQANATRNCFAALSVGASSTMQNIAKPDLLATPIAIPNDDEVVEIVTYLDAKTAEIDSLIDAKKSMADKLREYRRSLISEAVTGKFKVPGI